jgi:hypothetical protein
VVTVAACASRRDERGSQSGEKRAAIKFMPPSDRKGAGPITRCSRANSLRRRWCRESVFGERALPLCRRDAPQSLLAL